MTRNESLWSQLYLTYGAVLLRHYGRRSPWMCDVEDLVQVVIAQAVAYILQRDITEPDQVRRLVWHVANRRWISALRRQARHLATFDYSLDGDHAPDAVSSADVHRQALSREFLAEIHESSDWNARLLRAAIDGTSDEDLAREAGVKPATVRVRRWLLRQQFAAAYADSFG